MFLEARLVEIGLVATKNTERVTQGAFGLLLENAGILGSLDLYSSLGC